MKKRILLQLSFFTLAATSIFAQSVSSTQAHEGKINHICASPSADGTFFSVGNDGFLIKWSDDGFGEHYQVTDQIVKTVEKNPVTNDLALYETDGVSFHRVSVYDAKTFQRKFYKKFSDSVTSVSFSEKGNFLIVGTTAVNGTYIYNARTGSQIRRLSDLSGIISYAKTSTSEKTCIMYSPAGSIIYYDMVNYRQKVKFSTEPMLSQVMVFGNGKLENRFFAGVKDNLVYLIDATSGKIIATYSAKQPLIFASKNDYEDKQGLYFISDEGNRFSLKLVNSDMLIKQLSASSSQIFNPQSPLIVKYFTGVKARDTFTCGTKDSGSIILGTQSGNIYTLTDIPESEMYSLFPITSKMYEKIFDIDTDGTDFYLLTKDAVYKTNYDSRMITTLAANRGQTNLIKYNDYALLWSKNTKQSVELLSFTSGESKVLFTPETTLRNLRIFADKIVYVMGTSTVGLYDLSTGENKNIYSGTSIQDVVLVDDNTLYVAKSSGGVNDSPIISVNINTKETVPLKVSGNVAYSLSYDYDSSNDFLYGVMLKNRNGSVATEVFSYNTKTSVYLSLMTSNEEDSDAFTTLSGSIVYSNVGKNQVYSLNTATKTNRSYRRSASMPIKVECTSSRIAVLNHNGSISWYSLSSQQSNGDWYLTVEGDWVEF